MRYNGDSGWGKYESVRQLNRVAEQLVAEGFSSNIEGAVVGSDGALFLVTDNEDRGPTDPSNSPNEAHTHGKTAFLVLPPAGK